jgi:DNA-directed RNA polymerase subunit RPC12/RpoP
MDDVVPIPVAANTAEPAVPTDSEFLRSYLAGRDVSCPTCGYNLRDLLGTRCPECGDELVLKVNTAEPRLAVLICGIIALAAGAGFSGLLLILVMADGGSVSGDVLLVIFFGLLIESSVLVLWVKSWRKVKAMPSWRQSLMVSGCVALTAANVVAFVKRVH